MQSKNVDDLLINQPVLGMKQDMIQPSMADEGDTVSTQVDHPTKDAKDAKDANIKPVEQSKVETKTEQPAPDAKNVDDYGNELPKPRMYSEEELQQRIRERLSRGHQAQQQPQQQTQQQPSANQEPWEAELEAFVDKTIQKRDQTRQQNEWQKREQQTQAAFESKFNLGMEKYTDFREVVSGKPITDAMMLATRDMENPAGFIYAASKLQPAELDRIAKIPDPMIQAREIGKLDERMRKSRNVTNAPAPIRRDTSDIAHAEQPKKHSESDINNRISEYGRGKRIR